MSAAPVLEHAVRGRLRVHLDAWSGERPEALRSQLLGMTGVVEVSARPATRNVVLRYDPAVTGPDAVMHELAEADLSRAPGSDGSQTSVPPKGDGDPRRDQLVRGKRSGRARIAIRGLERNPHLARRLVKRLEARRDVRRVQVNPQTGRALIEFSDQALDAEDLLADLSDVELVDRPGEDLPSHPLDPVPLIQSTSRLAGSTTGLAIIGIRALTGRTGPLSGAAVGAAAAIGLAEGLPPVQRAVRSTLGRDRAELALGVAGAIALTASGAPLGLAMTAAGALRLVTEVRARRNAWRAYEDRLGDDSTPMPGDTIRVVAGDRLPLRGRVVEGHGATTGADGLPRPVQPDSAVDAGARVVSGRLVVELAGHDTFDPPVRPVPAPLPPVRRYAEYAGLFSVGWAALTLVRTRSPARALTAALLVNPRPAMVGADMADAGASARVLRAGATIVGTRPDRFVHLPDVLVLERPRVAAEGFEVAQVMPLADDVPAMPAELVDAALHASGEVPGDVDTDGGHYRLDTAEDVRDRPAYETLHERGEHVLALRADTGRPVALVGLRPRSAPGLDALVAACERRGTPLVMVEHGDRFAARAAARRANAELAVEADARDVIADLQRRGRRVGLVADSADAAEALAAADLGVALTSGRSGHFPARADLLAPDLSTVAEIIETGARRDQAGRASAAASLVANAFGVVQTFRGRIGIVRASESTYLAALAAMGAGWVLLRGGGRSRSVATRLADPKPERWGRDDPAVVLERLGSSASGLSAEQVAARREHRRPVGGGRHPVVSGVLAQLRSPLAAVLAAGAGLSVAMGATADVPIIAAVIAANALVGGWQELRAGRAAAELERMGAQTACVVRDGEPETVPADAVVPGDILVVSSGDRLVADARVLEAEELEVDEAALTGESLSVTKHADEGSAAARVLLEGSGVVAGSGRAVVVAVGRMTRLGATAAAIAETEVPESPLSRRLARLLRDSLPIIVAGGMMVTVAGVLRGGRLATQLAIGSGAAIAAVPEGLPLMAGVAEAAVATRLAARRALVRRPAAVETLGRVDVACFDKTGTLTEGRLAVRRVCDLEGEAQLPGSVPARLRRVLAVAAEASPSPDTIGAEAHATDAAVVQAAAAAGIDRSGLARDREIPFASSRGFHATQINRHVSVKGAAEVLLPRCTAVLRGGRRRPMDERERAALVALADRLAGEGLRILLVARGAAGNVEDPQDLTALGFVGISDPLRAGVTAAVDRCHRAGVRLIMLTGDYPVTARAIAAEVGLSADGRPVLTGDEMARLDDAALDQRLGDVEVVARITPLDKLRIVESLQRRGHTVAMTGDGVNDAPALRLADVGVAMGHSGTEVARQAADVVLRDDELGTMVEALVEGRAFWQNMRRALALLLGGNLGEVGLIAGAAALAGGGAMTARQILTVNLVTDVLPALAVAVQPPEHRDLATLAREGTTALDTPLRQDIIRRGVATAAPSLAAFLAARRLNAQGSGVAFGSIVGTQLAQTLDLGRAEGRLSAPVVGAVGASAALTAVALTLPPLRAFLGLAAPTLPGLVLIGAASLSAVALSRLMGATA
jgi:calcium-translocating P-type ATPase